MKISGLINLLLQAKVALLVVVGQIALYFLIFDAVKEHDHRMIEIIVSSVLLWIAFGLSLLSNRAKRHKCLNNCEKHRDEALKKLKTEKSDYETKLSEYEQKISALESEKYS